MQLILSIGIVIVLLISSSIGMFSEEKINEPPSSNIDEIIETNEDIQKEKIKENLGNIKCYFTKNQGQLENDDIYFTYSLYDKTFGFSESSILIKLSKKLDDDTSKSSVIKINFENSNNIIPRGIGELNHKSNYYIGNDSSEWQSNIPNYEKIVYENLYYGIDLIYYFNDIGLKYDWIVKPYSNPNQIVEKFEGINSIKIDSFGALIVNTETGKFIEKEPYSYQNILGNKIEVKTNFNLINNNTITYDIENYDSSNYLIIDPLIYSTYIGGNGDDKGFDIKLDSENNVYISGPTTSVDFPNTLGSSHNGTYDVFVLKMKMSGNNKDDLIFSTFIGGSAYDGFININTILDSDNNIYVTGQTRSEDFPTTDGCYNNQHKGNDSSDVFVFKLNHDGSKLIYSTFVGGGYWDYSSGIVLDSNKNAYVNGYTDSSNFPTTSGSYDESFNGDYDVFVFKLKSDGTDLLYSTYIGGIDKDWSYAIRIDSENNAYITGFTRSSELENFPTTIGCYDNSYNGDDDVFVIKLNSDGSDIIYSTYVGGEGTDRGGSLKVDSLNNIYAVGRTNSKDFPNTTGTQHNGDFDIFVFNMNLAGNDKNDMVYSTYIGGKELDIGMHIDLDSNNNAYVVGLTSSLDFPTSHGCYDDSYNGGNSDLCLFKLNHEGSDLLYSTYIGGEGMEDGGDIILDSDNNVYIDAHTKSKNFLTTYNCYNDVYNEGDDFDTFALKLNLTKLTTYAHIDSISPNPANDGEKVYFYGNGTTEYGTIEEYRWYSNIEGYLSNKKSFTISNLTNGTHKIYFKVKNSTGVWSDENSTLLTINGIPKAEIDEITPIFSNEGDEIKFTGNYTDFENSIIEYYWESSIDGFLSNGKSFKRTSLSNGTHTIYFKVKDNYNAWSEFDFTTITINGNPRAKIDEITPNPSNEGDEIWFYGNGTDDGAIEGYEWNSSIDGFISGQKSFSISSLSSGRHSISFTVKDNYGVWSEKILTSLKIGIPLANVDIINPNPSNEGELVWFYGNGTDDGTIEEYRWNSNIDGFLSFERSFSASTLLNGTHTIYFKVKDNDGFWSDEVFTTLTINGVPKAIINDINQNFANETEEIWFYGIGTDDGAIKQYYWSSDMDGFLSNETSFILTNLSNGTHTIYFKVKDNYDAWSKEVSSTLTINGIPYARIQEITPKIANIEETILFNGIGIDDGTVVDYNWKSSVEGFLSNKSSFTTTSLSNGIHMIYFKVKDNVGFWSEEVFTTVIINVIPQGIIDEIKPNIVLVGKTVYFYGNGTDDGTIESYRWSSDIVGFLSSEKSFSLSNLSIGIHTISFKVKDNFGTWSEIVTEIIRIRDNLIPIAIISSPVEGEEFYENKTIHFDGSKSSDADNDKLTFIWMLNDEQISTKSRFDKNLEVGNYKIKLKIDDGFGGLSTAEVSISVIKIPESFITLDPNDIIIEGTPIVDIEIRISVKIHNPSMINGNATIKFYLDTIDNDHLIGDEQISLPALQDLTVSTYWTPKIKGTCTIIVMIENIEPTELIIKNNKAQKSIEVIGKSKVEESFVSKNPVLIIGIGLGAFLSLYIGGTEIGRYKFFLTFLLPLYMRLNKDDKEEILDHFVRGRIFGYIDDNPGIHYRELMKKSKVKNGVLSYHLGVLEKTGIIKSRSEGIQYKAFYPTNMKFPEEERFRLTELQIKIMNKIKEKPGISQKEIASTLGLRQQKTNYNIRALERAKKLRTKRKGRKSYCYEMNPTIQSPDVHNEETQFNT